MANTFGILAVLVLAFSAFVAHKNKEEHQTQLDNIATQERNLDRNTKTFTTLLNDTTALNEETTTTNTERDDFQAKLNLQQGENTAIEKTIADKEAELNEVKTRVADAKDKLKELGDLRGLADKIKALNSSVAQLEDDLQQLEAQNTQLSSDKQSSADRSAALSKELSDRMSGRSRPSLRTSVVHVSTSLGFVTLAGGDNVGVVSGSKLDVKRGDDTIAQLRVTGVSGSSSTADIIASTVVAGESVSAGDKVVASDEEAK
ncbi:MAG: hypothetical protein ACON5N_07465 [Akkermansiaceae bacterium]